MQGMVSDKTFHLKWNNHLQNLSQLFSTIYSSSALADVTLSCRDGTLKAHKLVLSACSPYFEQIFKDNPCQHPIVILKGIPFSEINLLVEFMYKGSVDVQELDLQSLMHTAAELEIRGLAYEARDNAAQMLNVNLEYPTYPQTQVPGSSSQYPQTRTDVERLKQIHLYQQSMMRAEELRRRRRDDPPTTHTAVNNILAAAAREMEEARHVRGSTTMDHDQATITSTATGATATATSTSECQMKREIDDDRPKKRSSILSPEDDKLRVKKKMTVRFQDEHTVDKERTRLSSPVPESSLKITAIRSLSGNESNKDMKPPGGIKVVSMAALKAANNDHDEDSDEKLIKEEDEETDSSGSVSDSAANDSHDGRPHVCDFCDQRFSRSSHLSRHRLTHTGERPFTCGGCGRSFARSDKLRVHTKICEKEDPTVAMANANDTKRDNSQVMSGMVRTTHRESGHLVFTASGDVMLPPRQNAVLLNSQLDPVRNEIRQGDLLDPPRRGRGRPRKTPLPLLPKIKKRRGRPPKTSLDINDTKDSLLVPDETKESLLVPVALPRRGPGRPRKTPAPESLPIIKTESHFHSTLTTLKKKRGRPPKKSLDMEGCVLTSGTIMPTLSPAPLPSAIPHSSPTLSGPGMQAMMKKRRGRPPKNFYVTRTLPDGRPNENYNATNLPFGDFAYLTEMMQTYNPLAYNFTTHNNTVSSIDTDHSVDTSRDRTIDVSDSSTEEDENSRVELEENVPAVAMETQIMTVGDCQIVKLPNSEDDDKTDQVQDNSQVPTSTTSSAVTITPINTVGDCTIQPVENNT